MELYELPFTEIVPKIKAREISPVELAESSLARLEAVEPVITAFATVTADVALAQARKAEAEIGSGQYKGPLHGIPLGVKDLYDTAGIRTTSSSAQRADYVPQQDSVAVAKLAEAGMVLIGKTHTHEFAYGATTPTTGNPWDPSRNPGGSSGGSGAAVAAGVVPVALGSDTGGSIRIPSAICGTVGLKPTYGRASRVGVASLSWSLDHVGPLARNVTEAALVMEVMSGYDRRDPASANVPPPELVSTMKDGVAGTKIGIPTNFYTTHVDPEVETAWRQTAALLESLGAVLIEVEVPYADLIEALEWGILIPEAGAYHRDTMRQTPELFTDEVRTFNEISETILALDYIQALRLRGLLQAGFREMFEPIDVLLAPTVPIPAAARDQQWVTWPDGFKEGVTASQSRLCGAANLTGLPALAVPSGFSATGLPLGVQIIARPFREADAVRVGYALEEATDLVGRIAPVV
ncbi:MAG: amidase [Bifidobacteriaceae bacterium]|nr:amidase [Bifidobacteriaceae bacterium]